VKNILSGDRLAEAALFVSAASDIRRYLQNNTSSSLL